MNAKELKAFFSQFEEGEMEGYKETMGDDESQYGHLSGGIWGT